VDQLVAIFDSVETREDFLAADRACESAQHTLNDADRGRVVRSMVAAASRALTWRARRSARTAEDRFPATCSKGSGGDAGAST
jgi:hypothetical protein